MKRSTELPLFGARALRGGEDRIYRRASITAGETPHFTHFSPLPQPKTSSGVGSRSLAAHNTLFLGDDNELFRQVGETKKKGTNASRGGLVSVSDECEVCTGEVSGGTLSTSSSACTRHHRYEHPFTAYQLVSDPYDRHREIERQQRFINDSKRIGRPFLPSGGRALEKPTRYMLGDCVAALYRTAARDWPEADPIIISSAEDLVVLYFKRDRIRNTSTLMRYMNASLKRNEAVRAFDLRKVEEGWDVITDDGHIMYTFRPPWVRQQRFLPGHVMVRKAH